MNGSDLPHTVETRARREAPMVGRAHELATIVQLIDRARAGRGGVLVIAGEAGLGKTRLLTAATSDVDGFAILRAVGVQSEMRLGFAAVQQLVAPPADRIDSLPHPQARALRAALGLAEEAVSERYLVSLAVLTLITTAAATGPPLLVVVDDVQWLDDESAAALGFLGRRLREDRVCVLLAVREPVDIHRNFDGLPIMALESLSHDDSITVLEWMAGSELDGDVRERILNDAAGNPLAIEEFALGLTAEQARGDSPLPDLLPVDRRWEVHFGRIVAGLPPPTRELLLTIAAQPQRDDDLTWRAGRALAFDDAAIAAAHANGVLRPGTLEYRHPLIRAAVYQGAEAADRRRVHAALAGACDPEQQSAQRAWHRAAAALLPDEDIAAELERAAKRAADRGGASTAAALLERATAMTPDAASAAVRHLSAATAAMSSGGVVRARGHVDRALRDLQAPMLRARALQLKGMIDFLSSDGSSGESIVAVVDAARALAAHDVHAARDVMLDAIVMARILGETSPMSLAEVARVARTFTLGVDDEPTTTDLVLDGVAELFTDGLAPAAPAIRRGLAAVLADPEARRNPRLLSRSCSLALALGDHHALRALATGCADVCRELGDFRVLSEALYYLAIDALGMGALDSAGDLLIEQRDVQSILRRESRPSDALELILASWHGDEARFRAMAADLTERTPELGVVRLHITHALIVMHLGVGEYRAASQLAPPAWSQEVTPLAALRAADAVEAHVRADDATAAQTAASYLNERARVTRSAFDQGLSARCEALLAEDDEREIPYRASIAALEECDATLHAARTRLLFGEWLRRRKRRRDAREQLAAAHEIFESIGALAFAHRAQVELLATGARARKRVEETRYDLTPQEWQIARLAAAGATNPEIAARLFISASTVDYHLRKVYRKVGVASRHKLIGVLSTD